MTENKMETIITELVVNGGDARGKALGAIKAARDNDMDKAEKLMAECNEALLKAHNFQTSFIQETLASDEETPASLLMVHGQDHLMDAMVVRDLAAEMIEMYRMIHSLSEKAL